MRIGISAKINVSKIEKARLYKGKTGTFLDITTFVNLDETDQYGNNGFISQVVSKEKGVKGPILGNCKVFWTDMEESKPIGRQEETEEDSSIPF